MPRLNHLNLDGCRSLTDKTLCAVSSPLSFLSVYWNPHVTDKGICSVAELSNKTLTSLNLSGTKHIKDKTLVSLTAHCTEMTHLDLTRCTGLSDKALGNLCEKLDKLQSLLLYACGQFRDQAVQAAVQHCRMLHTLDVCGFNHITDDAFAVVECVQLTSLNITWCVQLTDKTLIAIAAQCKKLQSVQLMGLRDVSDSGIQALADGCPDMEQLNINGCPSIKLFASRQSLITIFPKFQKLLPMF
eukprot:c8936_g1_i1.p1 GENE.c8936_g1_i1~~c8936_g1_i1.p1  ORF type:complete len:243 (-),score=64.41 c8936_g1_i1:28-756(-)